MRSEDGVQRSMYVIGCVMNVCVMIRGCVCE